MCAREDRADLRDIAVRSGAVELRTRRPHRRAWRLHRGAGPRGQVGRTIDPPGRSRGWAVASRAHRRRSGDRTTPRHAPDRADPSTTPAAAEGLATVRRSQGGEDSRDGCAWQGDAARGRRLPAGERSPLEELDPPSRPSRAGAQRLVAPRPGRGAATAEGRRVAAAVGLPIGAGARPRRGCVTRGRCPGRQGRPRLTKVTDCAAPRVSCMTTAGFGASTSLARTQRIKHATLVSSTERPAARPRVVSAVAGGQSPCHRRRRWRLAPHPRRVTAPVGLKVTTAASRRARTTRRSLTAVPGA